MKFYRYENHQDRIDEIEFDLLRETEKGYWIIAYYLALYDDEYKEKFKEWISKTSRKRYAYPTKEEAKKGFIARKRMECLLLKNRLNNAEKALVSVGDEIPKYDWFDMRIFSAPDSQDY